MKKNSPHLTQFMRLLKNLKKFKTSTGFEPVTSGYRCNALTNLAMKPRRLGAGQLCSYTDMFP